MRKKLEYHGGSSTAEYRTWTMMIARCTAPLAPGFERYGARGITVCAEWRNSFAAFIRDMGAKPTPKHSIDRINNDGNYEPANCRWATATEQARNRHTTKRVGGVVVAEAAESAGVPRRLVEDRLRSGRPLHEALSRYHLRRLTVCRRGHARSGSNLYTYPNGRTKCRPCMRHNDSIRKERRSA